MDVGSPRDALEYESNRKHNTHTHTQTQYNASHSYPILSVQHSSYLVGEVLYYSSLFLTLILWLFKLLFYCSLFIARDTLVNSQIDAIKGGLHSN